VKFIRPDLLEPQESYQHERFRHEATATAKAKSPHVVQMLDRGVMADGTPYLVMELLEGESLRQRLRRDRSLPAAEVAEIVTQTARALSAAHERGIVHCDVKPGNVFLVDMGGPLFCKLLDFGIAKRMFDDVDASKTETGMLLGSPQYLSPQRMQGEPTDHYDDLWALAVMAYQALTGRLPFKGDSLTTLYLQACGGIGAAANAANAARTPALNAWFRKALAPECKDRFASAAELAESFRAAVRGRAPEGAARPCTAQATAAASALPGARRQRASGQRLIGASVTGKAAGRSSSSASLSLAGTVNSVSVGGRTRQGRWLQAAIVGAALAMAATSGGLYYALSRGHEAMSGSAGGSFGAAARVAGTSEAAPAAAFAATPSEAGAIANALSARAELDAITAPDCNSIAIACLDTRGWEF